MRVRRILVLRGGALGDFVVTLPALAALRQAYPPAEIELVGHATAAALAVNRGLLTRAHSQHAARWSALFAPGSLPPELREWLGAFDLVVSYWPDGDGTLARHFPVRAGQRFLSAAAMPTRAPAAAHYGAALAPLGIRLAELWHPLQPIRPVAPAAPPGLSQAQGQLAAGTAPTSRERIGIHPGSGSQKKNWPANRWIELIARLASPVTLIIGEAESEAWSRTQLAATPLAPRLADGSLSVAAGLPLEELIAAVGACRLFVGHDSGVSHLAAAAGAPCVLLFGPTDPAVWAPPAPHVRVITRGDELTSIGVDDVLAVIGQATPPPARRAGESAP